MATRWKLPLLRLGGRSEMRATLLSGARQSCTRVRPMGAYSIWSVGVESQTPSARAVKTPS